jgi:phenylalanyl-tRNA synthetase beta subunit
MTASEIARKLATEFKGNLSEKDALEAYVERTLGNKHVPITVERIDHYQRLGVRFVRGLSGPQPEFG